MYKAKFRSGWRYHCNSSDITRRISKKAVYISEPLLATVGLQMDTKLRAKSCIVAGQARKTNPSSADLPMAACHSKSKLNQTSAHISLANDIKGYECMPQTSSIATKKKLTGMEPIFLLLTAALNTVCFRPISRMRSHLGGQLWSVHVNTIEQA
ncbi:hypothetical protein K469DRAFT_249804 [Zopfia rhizophila CBS 207.26]|uniref:Uncharacterized protein n=1 Tax=Zopfia rhizophila CBS 207.26 TaxID=1314779 RepID=A0A6A6DS93_9PEZI|nr:hypothetical protein K469DRAFT_249804 [Zopfia rhizophila CBS 207.26]